MSSLLKFISKTGVLFAALIASTNLSANAFPHFDHDNKADLAVFRPGDRNWYALSSERQTLSATQWGLATDHLVPADYDGDGLTDIAVWRQRTGDWFILRSSDQTLFSVNWGGLPPPPPPRTISFLSPDMPMPGDYDGDGRSDIAVWRPDSGVWYVLNSSNGYSPQAARVFQWGKLGDVPLPADYDGDGKTDFAVARERWYIFQSKTGTWKTSDFGNQRADWLAPADYTGDGKTDAAVYYRGLWVIERSEDGQKEFYNFGSPDDMPAPADFDGDGRADIAVFRSGTWYIRRSANGQMSVFNFGASGDVPLSSLTVKSTVVAIP